MQRQGNIPITSFFKVEKCWVNKYSNKNLGYDSNLIRQYIGALRNIIIVNMRTILQKNCFKEYAIIFDASQSFSEAECVVIRSISIK